MKKYNCSVEMGVELVSLEQFDDRVEVELHKYNAQNSDIEEESSKYEWVVGADGARGVVRKLLGLTFLGETQVEHFMVGDIKTEGLVDVGFPLFSLPSTIQRWHSEMARMGRLCKNFVSIMPETGDRIEMYFQKERRFGIRKHQAYSTL